MIAQAEESTASSFQGIKQVIEARWLFSLLYTDRGSHYWYTPEAGGKVDKNNPRQFGRAMHQYLLPASVILKMKHYLFFRWGIRVASTRGNRHL